MRAYLSSLSFIFLLPLAVFSSQAPNILFISVDDLRPELASFGADYIHSPNMDRLANQGRPFARHYVQAPTCGASRYTLLTGLYGSSGNSALFERARRITLDETGMIPSLPAFLKNSGYTTIAVGKISHHPGGKGGPEWNDPIQIEMPHAWDKSYMPSGSWLSPKGAMHGLANGEIRTDAGSMDVYQSFDGDDMSYPDGLIRQSAIHELANLSKSDKPFFLAVGFIRPHLPFGAPQKYLDLYKDAVLPPIPHPDKPEGRSTWHRSGEFMKYNRWGKDPRKDPEFAEQVRRHYAASVSYTDAQIGYLLEALERNHLSENTIIVLWGDHGWHLGEHSIWGKHSLFEESLRAPLIIKLPGDMNQAGKMSEAIVETIDLYPTLCELLGLEAPDGLDGQSILSEVDEPNATGGTGGYAISYHHGARSVVSGSYRLIVHENDGFLELYDHESPESETHNIAAKHPKIAQRLLAIIQRSLADPSK